MIQFNLISLFLLSFSKFIKHAPKFLIASLTLKFFLFSLFFLLLFRQHILTFLYQKIGHILFESLYILFGFFISITGTLILISKIYFLFLYFVLKLFYFLFNFFFIIYLLFYILKITLLVFWNCILAFIIIKLLIVLCLKNVLFAGLVYQIIFINYIFQRELRFWIKILIHFDFIEIIFWLLSLTFQSLESTRCKRLANFFRICLR